MPTPFAGSGLGFGLGALGGILGGVGQGVQQADVLGQRQQGLDIQRQLANQQMSDVPTLFKAMGLPAPQGVTGPMPRQDADLLLKTAVQQNLIEQARQRANEAAGQIEQMGQPRQQPVNPASLGMAAPGATGSFTSERPGNPNAGLAATLIRAQGSVAPTDIGPLTEILGLKQLAPHAMAPGSPGVYDPNKGFLPSPWAPQQQGQGASTPPNIPLPAGQQWTPRVDELTGRVTWHAAYPPAFNPGQLTHEDAAASLISQRKLPPGARWGALNDQQNAAVANELIRMQNAGAADKARIVTINTGEAKQEIPLGASQQQWLNAKGEFPSPNLSQRQAIEQGYMPYKDAVKRLDQEGASRTFLQHIAYLRDKATDLFPESTGNSVGDLAIGQAAATKRRILGQSDPGVAAILAIDRPAALQMVKAVAPDARAGARLVSMFQEISNPYAPWTKQSYKQAIDSLEQLALTGMAQRGRPGMVPQPAAGGVAVSPASNFERSPTIPNQNQNSPQTKGEILSRRNPLYQKARQRGLSDQQIQSQYGVTVTD